MAIIGWQGISVVFILCINAINNEIPIEISGNTIFSSHYLIADRDKIRTKSELEQVIEHILTKYTEAGFPFCRVSPIIVEQDNNIEKIILEIREGGRVVIADYVFTINGKTDRAALRKILNIGKDNFFSSKEITRLKNKMLKTGVESNMG